MRAAAATVLLGLAAVGCGNATVSLVVHLPTAPDPYDGVDTIRIDVVVAGQLEETASVPFAGPGLVDTTVNVPPSEDTVIVLRGFSADAAVAEGRTAPLDVESGASLVAPVFFGRKAMFNSIGDMGEARAEHTATVLTDGRVLIAGGALETGGNPQLAMTLEVYDPECACFETLNLDSNFPRRRRHSATVLISGAVVVFGGRGPGGATLDDGVIVSIDGLNATLQPLTFPGMPAPAVGGHVAERFGSDLDVHVTSLADTFRMSVSPSGTVDVMSLDQNVPTIRGGSSVLLDGDRALVAGGFSGGGANSFTNTVGIFTVTGIDPLPGSDVLSVERALLSATLLPDGNVLLFGGENTGGPSANADAYLAASGVIGSVSDTAAFARTGHTGSALRNTGDILLAGGTDQVSEIFRAEDDPGTSDVLEGSFIPHEPMMCARRLHTATVLPEGTVLIVGGFDILSNAVIAGAEVYNP